MGCLGLDLAEVIGRIRFVRDVEVNARVGGAVFNWNRDGKWDVFLYWLKDGVIEKVTSGPDSYLSPTFSPQGDLVAYLRDREGDENFQVIVRELGSGREEDITRDPSHYHFDPAFSPSGRLIAFTSNRSGKPSQLHVYEDGVIRAVTSWDEPIFDYDWVSDEEIVYVRGIYDTEVRIVNIHSLEDRPLLHFPGAETFLGGVDVEKRRFLFYSNAGEWFDIGEYDLGRGEWRWVYRSSGEKRDPEYYGDSVLFIEYSGGRNYLKKLDGERITVLESNVEEFSVDGDLIAYIKSSSRTPSALYVNGKLVVDTTPQELRGALVEAIVERYESFDGRVIEAIVYKPREWRGSAIVYIHGGPDAHVYDTWCPLCQLLALQGYMVIAPNYRGSTGYGRSFLHLNDRDLGGGDLRDVVQAGLLARRMGARRVYAAGASYGGYLTALALVKEPDLWDGGIAIVGFYNWYTEYENEADYLKAYDRIKMDPNLFHDRSPIFHLEKLKAPILLIHGANDPRCPVEEVKQMAEKLGSLGKEYELVIYPDEGHSIRKESNRIDMYRRITAFLEKLERRDARLSPAPSQTNA